MERAAIRITDVFLRDGLQAVGRSAAARSFDTARKVRVLESLVAAGVPEIEVTGFVRPGVIPILADAEAVAEQAARFQGRVVLRALVPNLKGAERAVRANIRKLSALLAVSPTYQRLNSRMTVAEGLEGVRAIVRLAAGEGITVAAALAIAFICPYEGVVPEARLRELVERLVEMGITEICLADSVGLAWPSLVKERIHAVRALAPQVTLALHLHNLAGMGVANAYAALEAGVVNFDGSVGGVGAGIAMPAESLALGNVATEDLNYLFRGCGLATGIDQGAIATLGRSILALVGGGGSHAAHFRSLEAFLTQSRKRLPQLEAAPPAGSGREGPR